MISRSEGATMSTPSLMDLAPQYAAVIEEMLDAGGDLSDEALAERLNAIEGEFGTKVERCQIVYRRLVAEAAGDEMFAAPWVERAAKKKRAAERLKGYVYACMVASGQKRIETELGGARLQVSPPSAKCEVPLETLPDWLRRTTVAFDAAKAVETYRQGLGLPDGVRIEVGSHLRWL